MLPYQQRVIDEKKELDEKLLKLFNFFSTDAFNKLDSAEKGRLRIQHSIMMAYSEILGQRIANFQS